MVPPDMMRVPEAMTRAPEKVLFPERTRVPAPTLVKPKEPREEMGAERERLAKGWVTPMLALADRNTKKQERAVVAPLLSSAPLALMPEPARVRVNMLSGWPLRSKVPELTTTLAPSAIWLPPVPASRRVPPLRVETISVAKRLSLLFLARTTVPESTSRPTTE